MGVTARRKITITYSGDVEGENELNATTNQDSPGQIQIVSLEVGGNAFDVPAGATAVTVVPPADNASAIELGGLRIHDTDPTTIALHSSVSSVTIDGGHAEGTIDGVRLYWS